MFSFYICFLYYYIIYVISISLKLKLSPVLKVYTPQHFKTNLSELKHRYISCVNFGLNMEGYTSFRYQEELR